MGGENKKETEKIISEKVNRRKAATLVIGWWLPPAAERRARVEVFFFIFSLVSIFFFSVCWLLLFSSLRKSTWALLVVFLSFPCREDDEPRPPWLFPFFSFSYSTTYLPAYLARSPSDLCSRVSFWPGPCVESGASSLPSAAHASSCLLFPELLSFSLHSLHRQRGL